MGKAEKTLIVSIQTVLLIKLFLAFSTKKS